MRIMIGKDSVDKMYDDLLKDYENKGLSKMIEEVNASINEQLK